MGSPDDPSGWTVTLADVLGDLPDIELTYRQFAENGSPEICVFLRVIRLDELETGSGWRSPIPQETRPS